VSDPAVGSRHELVRYDAKYVVDDKPETAWRCNGSGEGQQITLTLPHPSRTTAGSDTHDAVAFTPPIALTFPWYGMSAVEVDAGGVLTSPAFPDLDPGGGGCASRRIGARYLHHPVP
jgi:hypothetical protein